MSSNAESPFPPPRRILTWHPLDDPTGNAAASVEQIPLKLHPAAGFYRAPVIVQDFPADPHSVAEYSKADIQPGFVKKDALSLYVLDFAPGHRGRLHFIRSFEYVVMTRGSITLETTGGQKFNIGLDDIAIAAANVHYWHNETNEWARMICFLSYAEEVKFEDGRVLAEVHPTAFGAPL